jgi:hypothetical protein
MNEQALVEQAKEARVRAEKSEEKSSPFRWQEADAYAELADKGWSVRRIADECRTNFSSVAKFIRCSHEYPVSLVTRPSFWHAFQEQNSAAHVSIATGQPEWYTPPRVHRGGPPHLEGNRP